MASVKQGLRCGKATTVGAVLAAGLLFAPADSAAAEAQEGKTKPNIIVIMTDDVGFGDLGSYGGGIMRGAPTPNLDRIPEEGMRFADYYGQASSTAGRASLSPGAFPSALRSRPYWRPAIRTD